MRTSTRVGSFTESVIREMTRLAMEHDAVNLAQGFPDFSCPPELKEAAKAAIDGDVNQYAITCGAPSASATPSPPRSPAPTSAGLSTRRRS
jgi:aspartate/methionine/tyrosine aminotransferase